MQQNGWTFGRKGNGYVALWSWRPTQWRTYTDPGIYTHGLTKPFDLVAPGGADDVWFTQVGDAKTFGDFATFRAAVLRGADPRRAAAPVNGLRRRLRRELRVAHGGLGHVRHHRPR